MSLISRTFFPLGCPLQLATECRRLIEVAEEEWSCWRQRFDAPPIVVTVEVTGESGLVPPPAQFAGHRDKFTFVADSKNHAEADLARRSVTMRLTSEAVGDAAYLKYHFLEAAAYQLIAALHLAPIHGACVTPPGNARGGILLCGESGAGKSSLAYACARSGWTYTSDDASYLVRGGPELRSLVVANAHRLRLRPQASALFPELVGRPLALRGNGDERFEMWTRELGIRATATATPDRILFLDRQVDVQPHFSEVSRSEAAPWFATVFYYWAPEIAAEQEAALGLLLNRARLERFTYSKLADAVTALGA